MLVQLSIRDIVLIERLDLAFEAGLSVLTGETGAGKSILLDSLSLALGGRGDGSLVRHGEDKGQVTAVFDVDGSHAARTLLRGNGVDDDGDLIFRRIQSADGRTRAFINDQAVSVQLMRQAGQLLVEIHGQHDDRALIDTDAHRMLLDAFAGLSDEAVTLGESYRRWRDAERSFKTHKAKVEAAAREADYLRASVEELEALSPQDGEEEELAERRSRMQKSERIAGDISEASEFLNGNASPVPHIASLMRKLERKSHEAPGLLEETVQLLGSALDTLSSAQMEVEAALRRTEFDPRELERVEERLFALRAAGRKYSVAVADLPALAEKMVADLADLDAAVAAQCVEVVGVHQHLVRHVQADERDRPAGGEHAVGGVRIAEDVGLGHRAQDLEGDARLVGHAEDGDFGFIAVEGDARDDGLFHVAFFLKRNQGAGNNFFGQRH